MNQEAVKQAFQADFETHNPLFPQKARLLCVFLRKEGRHEVVDVRILDATKREIKQTDSEQSWWAHGYIVNPHSFDVVLGNFGKVEAKATLAAKPCMFVHDSMRGIHGTGTPVTREIEDALISVNLELGVSQRERRVWKPLKQLGKWLGYAGAAYLATVLLYTLAMWNRIHP